MRTTLIAAAAAFGLMALGLTTPAQSAVTYIGASSPCSISNIAGASACAGFYSGNGIAGTPNAADNRQDAFTRLGLGGSPVIIDTFESSDSDAFADGVINFGQVLFGQTVISAHWGNLPGAGNVSAMYVFNFLVPTYQVQATAQGFSNARLFSTGTPAPEPGAWALMILGFGGAGAMLRRRRPLAA